MIACTVCTMICSKGAKYMWYVKHYRKKQKQNVKPSLLYHTLVTVATVKRGLHYVDIMVPIWIKCLLWKFGSRL